MGTAYDRGLILYRQSRWAMAADEFRAELAAWPGSVMGHAMLGMSHLQLKQFDDAQAEIFEAARLGPDVGYTHFALAYLMLRDQPLEWSAVRRMKAGENCLWLADRLEKARAHLRDAISLEPENAENFSLLANVEYEARHWTDCLAAAERGLRIQPRHERCAWFRAHALWSLDRPDEAFACIRQSLSINPEQAAGHRLLGWMLLKQQQYDSAFEHLEQSLRLDPADSRAQAWRNEANLMRFARLGMLWKLERSNWLFLLLIGEIVLMVLICGNSTETLAPSPATHNALVAGATLLVFAVAAMLNSVKADAAANPRIRVVLIKAILAGLAAFWAVIATLALFWTSRNGSLAKVDSHLVVLAPSVPIYFLWVIKTVYDRRTRLR